MSVRVRPVKPTSRIMDDDPVIIGKLAMRARWTPDFATLRFFDRIPVLVFDDLQREGRDHYLLDGAEYLGKGVTITSTFKMFTTGRAPVVFKEDDTTYARGGIRGEVYNLGVEHVHVLDREYRNTDKVIRQIEKVILEDQDPECITRRYKGIPWIHCFMYLGNKPMWNQTGGLKIKPLQEVRGRPILEGRKFYQWDAWEAGWEDSWGYGMGMSQNYPYGNEHNHPFVGEKDEQSFLNLNEWYQDRDGVWHKVGGKGNDEWLEPHIG